MEKYIITEKSKNAKTGPIMVVTSPSDTCPDVCPLKAGGCYAKGGPLAAIWRGLDATPAGEQFTNGRGKVTVRGLDALIDMVKSQTGKLWRFNQAGDLPGIGNGIDGSVLADLVIANLEAKAKGFTYTHKPVGHNTRLERDNMTKVKDANERGFTINLSANDLDHADELVALNVGPVAAVLPSDQITNTTTPEGHKVVVCPATIRDDVNCATCGLCARQRDFVIGFPAHGPSKKKADAIASGG
jgi:hypothetical protein